MVSPGRGQLPSRRRDHRSKSTIKIKILSPPPPPPPLSPLKRVYLLSWAGSRLNYALKGSLTVINEEFYTVDRTPTSIGLLLNEYNYNLPSLLLCFPPRYAGPMPVQRILLGSRSSDQSSALLPARHRSEKSPKLEKVFSGARSSVDRNY